MLSTERKKPMKKALQKEVSISEMLHMREEGMSNHQIAKALDVCDNTVYRYIGKRSAAVKKAEEQNKPAPVAKRLDGFEEVKAPAITVKPAAIRIAEDAPKIAVKDTPLLKTLRETRILDMKGSVCTYRVNTGDGSVEMFDPDNSSMITGILDKDGIKVFMKELNQIWGMLEKEGC